MSIKPHNLHSSLLSVTPQPAGHCHQNKEVSLFLSFPFFFFLLRLYLLLQEQSLQYSRCSRSMNRMNELVREGKGVKMKVVQERGEDVFV